FPLLIALLGRGGDEVGVHVGRCYAWNTVGAIAGSLAGGFGFLPLFSATGCWKLAACLLMATGIAATILSLRERQRAAAGLSLLAAAATVTFCFALGPTAVWRHSGIGAGRAEQPADPNDLRAWTNGRRRTAARARSRSRMAMTSRSSSTESRMVRRTEMREPR